jgi:hypothetical protein
VTFSNGATVLATIPIINGSATLLTTSLPTGTNTITASYSGDINYAPATGTVTETVAVAATATTVTAAANPAVFGATVTFTSTVAAVAPGAGSPTGSVEFFDGSTPIGTATLTGDRATITDSSLTVGPHLIRSVYLGDTNFATSGSTLYTETINKAASSVGIETLQGPVQYGQQVVLGASVQVVPPGVSAIGGYLTFYDGSNMIGTIPYSGGFAGFVAPQLLPGTHEISVVYGGSNTLLSDHSPSVTQLIVGAATTTSLSSSVGPVAVYGQLVTYSALVQSPFSSAGPPTGYVSFYDGTTFLGNGGVVNGVASVNAIETGAGAYHQIDAVYHPTQYFALSAAAPLVQFVNRSPSQVFANAQLFAKGVGFPTTVLAGIPGSGHPTGTLTFYANSKVIATEPLVNGEAGTFYVPLSLVLNKTIVVYYSGDNNFNPSISTQFKATYAYLIGPKGSTTPF